MLSLSKVLIGRTGRSGVTSGCRYAWKSTVAEPAQASVIDPLVVENPLSAFEGCVVNSHNEFDPLEEVIVGCVKDATIPEYHVSGKAVWPSRYWDMYKTKAGQPFPADLMKNAALELDNFAKILQAEGVTVRRPGTNHHLLF